MLAILFVVVCVVLRVVPHPPNFAPVGATAIFAGRTMKPAFGVAFTILAAFLGDVALAKLRGYPLLTGVSVFVYGSYALQAVVGRALRTKKGGAVIASLCGSVVFFVLSNLGVWLVGDLYPLTTSGLISCFVAAIPFFGGTLVGDLMWTVVLSFAYGQVATRLGENRFWVPVTPSGSVL
jgi:hypothetical protein